MIPTEGNQGQETAERSMEIHLERYFKRHRAAFLFLMVSRSWRSYDRPDKYLHGALARENDTCLRLLNVERSLRNTGKSVEAFF